MGITLASDKNPLEGGERDYTGHVFPIWALDRRSSLPLGQFICMYNVRQRYFH